MKLIKTISRNIQEMLSNKNVELQISNVTMLQTNSVIRMTRFSALLFESFSKTKSREFWANCKDLNYLRL